MRWRIYRLRHRNSAPFLPGRGRYSRRYQCEGSSAGCGPDRDQKSTWRWYQMSCFRVVPWCGGVVVCGGAARGAVGGRWCVVRWAVIIMGRPTLATLQHVAVSALEFLSNSGTIVSGKVPRNMTQPNTDRHKGTSPCMLANLNKSVTGLALNPMFALILRHCPWLV